MNTLREAAQQALEALEALQGGCTDSNDGTVEAITVWCPEIITALRAALAEPTPFEDVVTHGSAWSKDGKRIDPMSVYAEPVQDEIGRNMK